MAPFFVNNTLTIKYKPSGNKRSCLIELQFFPKTEKYVSLFTGGDGSDIVDSRNKLRKQIKANLVAAAAGGKDLEGIYFALVPLALCHILFGD